MLPRAIAVLSLAAAALTACSLPGGRKAPVDTAKIVDAIKTDEVHWNADWKSGDAARVAAHYAPDAVVMNPGAPPKVGTAAIKAAIDQTVNQQGFSLSFVSERVDVAASGDLAVTHGGYKMTRADPGTGATTTETGDYVTVFKPGPDGVWRAVWDINSPAGAPAPAPPDTADH